MARHIFSDSLTRYHSLFLQAYGPIFDERDKFSESIIHDSIISNCRRDCSPSPSMQILSDGLGNAQR